MSTPIDTDAIRAYLEGLALIAEKMRATEGVAHMFADEVSEALQRVGGIDPYYWDPLRYESAVHGEGWAGIAANVRALLERLPQPD